MGIKMTAKKFKGLRFFFLKGGTNGEESTKVVRRAKHAVSWMFRTTRGG